MHPLLAMPQMMTLIQYQLMSWPVGLSSANGKSAPWKSSSNTAWPISPTLLQKLQQESLRRNKRFLQGVERYRSSPLPAPQTSQNKTIRSKNGNLHFYYSKNETAKQRPLIFCIPSLINRYYILDLNTQSSLMRYINQLGYDALLLEWPIPTPENADKNAASYVLDTLQLLQEQWEQIDRPLIMLGYCMGGILALAIAQLFERVTGLVLLATPWNYGRYPLARLTSAQRNSLESYIDAHPLFSADNIQTLIYLSNSYRLYRRFSRFASMRDEEAIEQFVMMEHWANDGVPITRALARECLLEWPQHNTLARQEWDVAGERITPDTLALPALVVLPSHDQIVPEKSARPLSNALVGSHTIQPQGGHVGMVVGPHRQELHGHLANWLTRNFSG